LHPKELIISHYKLDFFLFLQFSLVKRCYNVPISVFSHYVFIRFVCFRYLLERYKRSAQGKRQMSRFLVCYVDASVYRNINIQCIYRGGGRHFTLGSSHLPISQALVSHRSAQKWWQSINMLLLATIELQ
jgi:hypothetical protein